MLDILFYLTLVEAVEYCRNRWKSLCKSFFQGLKRRGSHYYLHEHLLFLIENNRGKTKSTRQPEAALNDESRSTTNEQNYDEDLSQHEDLMDTINVVDDEDADSDSHTTSADESNELNNSREYTLRNATARGGVFIIDEVGEEANEGDNRRRLSYKRSCKRGLDPQLIGDLGDDEEPEGKRMRKITTDSRKSLTEIMEKQSDTMAQSTKRVIVRVDKIKINKQTNATASKDNNHAAEVDELWSKESNESNKPAMSFYNERPKMVDRFTFTNFVTKDSSTQYEQILNPQDHDEVFVQNVKNQMQQMNGRQKMNFKRKIYQSLLEVFDDATDFPGADEVLQLPPKVAPRVVNTTTGELRLMRELVALVQAAKNTPEIVNAKETVKTNPPANQGKLLTKTPSTPSIDNRNKQQSSPLSLSPTLDDDDLHFTIEDDDDVPLPHSWDEIKAKPTESTKTATKPIEENVMGLPRRVLQKVVRVSGPAGSTIVARDGDKKRIYRIYPKSANTNRNPAVNNKNGSNVGTFYVAPGKNSNEVPMVANKSPNNSPNITIRSFNKHITNPNETITWVNKSNPTSSNNIANKTPTGQQTSFKNVQPVNRILSPTTGYFKMVPSPKTQSTASTNQTSGSGIVSKVTAVPKNSMLPPTLTLPTKKPLTVRTHINAPPVIQRRYSICGPLPAEKSANHPAGATVSKNSPPTPTSISQIQISQPISLNSKAMKSSNNTNTQTVTSSVSTKLKPVSTAPLANIKVPNKAPIAALDPNSTASAATKTFFKQPEEVPILETAGTVGADILDPLFVKTPQIKSEPVDD